MGRGQQNALVASLLLAIFLFSLATPMAEPATELEHYASDNATPLGQTTTVSIGSYPDGVNDATSISVPNGEALSGIELSLDEGVLPVSSAKLFDSSADFDHSTAVFDGMDVNQSSLQILPQAWNYDFESGTFAPEWTLSGTSNWAIQTDTRLQGARLAKAGSITDNQESSMTLDVSQVPAASGSFRYSVSSESGWDYLLFCIDNTACSLSSGYSNQWSGTVNNGQHTFNIPATAQSLTWKYAKDTSLSRGSDTAWVDDIVITPAGGSGTGEGNWTSDIFGPGATLGSEPSSYGLMVIDAEVPTGSLFEWSLIDASTGIPIPGYQQMTDLMVDLGGIDWETTPSLRFKTHMITGQSGGPKIHSIGISGAISESFSENPAVHDWTLAGTSWTQSSGQVSGTGSVTSPIYRISNGFGALKTSIIATGAPILEANVDDKGWQSYPLEGYSTLNEIGTSIQFRFQSSGPSYSIDSFGVDTVRSIPNMGLRLDIGADGVSDWGYNGDDTGSFGMQNRLANGKICQTLASTPSLASVFDVLLPLSGIEQFGFTVSASSAMQSPYMNIKIAGSDVTNRGITNFQTAQYIEFSQSELSALNNALSNAADDRGIFGLPMARVSITIGSSQSSSDVSLCGIFAPYEASLNLNLAATSPLVQSLNQELVDVIAQGGVKEVRIPVRMLSSGSVKMTVNSVSSSPTLNPISITISPPVETLTPSTDWITVNSTFDLTPLGVTDAEAYIKNNGWSVDFNLRGPNGQSKILCPATVLPLTGLEVSTCQSSGFALGWSDIDANGEIKMIALNSYIQFVHTFQMPVSWNDESYASLNVMLVSPTGPTLPLNHVFGLGHANGIENDVALKRFTIESQSGLETDASSASLIQGTFVTVHAYLGFEGVRDAVPRTGQAQVRLLVDGQDKGSTNLIVNGIASIIYNVPSSATNLEMELELNPVVGQGFVYEVSPIANFTMDSIAPMLIGMDVDTFDHRDASPSTEINFILGDSPSLPHHADAHVWYSWADDSNSNGLIDEGEAKILPLNKPEDFLATIGEYTLTMDTSQAPDGEFVQGWLSVADGAGNAMIEGGSMFTPLFNIQIRSDGTPSLGTEFDLIWGQYGDGWLHPGEATLLQIPVWDINGVSDIESIELNLGSTESDSAIIYWSSENGQCYSNHVYIDVESCMIDDGGGIFSEQGAFLVNFSIEWGFDPDSSFVRIPTIQLTDRLGQNVVAPLYDATWQYSGELTLDTTKSALFIDMNEVSPVGAYASEESIMEYQGELVWYRSMRIIEQSLDLLMEIDGQESVVETYGNFSFDRDVPDQAGEHGLYLSMYNPPNGAILRGLSDDPVTTIFVDDNEPQLMEIRSPDSDSVILESDWSDLMMQLTVREMEQLDPDSLVLNYGIYPAGLGLNVAAKYDGQVDMNLLGGRAFGEQVPIAAILDIDDIISNSDRNEPLELRIWVSGQDMAGNPFTEDFNDIDAPFHTWDLEQRVPEFTFVGEPSVKYEGDSVRVDSTVEISAAIVNNGNADGSVQIVLELVESNGARTRMDARQLQVAPGTTTVYEGSWVPSRTGTMWLEVQILGSETMQTPTLRVKEAESEGFLGTVSEVNPIVLGVLVVLSIILVGLLVFGLRPAQPQKRMNPRFTQRTERIEQKLPAMEQQGPYGAQQQGAEVGQNPYQ